jgi:hypothetical protein
MKRILISLLGLLACAPLLAADTNTTTAAKGAGINTNNIALSSGRASGITSTTPPPGVTVAVSAAVTGAIAKLKAETNYSWTVKTELPGTDFTLEPTQGQAEKDGFMLVTMSFGGNSMQGAFKGGKVAMKMEDQWELVDTKSEEQGMGSFMARMKSAGDEAADLAGWAKALKAGDGGLWSSDLTDEGAKALMSFGPTPPKNAKASVKFWVKDGGLAKYETHATATVDFGGNEQDSEVIRTIDIHDQGKTKVAVPDEAKKKLEGK